MKSARFLLVIFRLSAFVATGVTTGPAALAADAISLVAAEDSLLSSMFLIGEGQKRPVLLFDPRDQEAVRRFASETKSRVRCFARDTTAAGVRDMMAAVAGKPCEMVDDATTLALRLWPKAERVVVVSDTDYSWLLQAASFAGVTGAALLPLPPGTPIPDPGKMGDWALRTLYLLPGVDAPAVATEPGPELIRIATIEDLWAQVLASEGREAVTRIVVANAADHLGIFSPSWLSMLSPLVSAFHHAPLILVDSAQANQVEAQVHAFIERNTLPITHVILVGDELALRSHRVPDPVLAAGGPEAIGGGTEVRVDLFSEIQLDRPQEYAVGRMVAESASQASVTLARQLHGRRKPARPVIVLSNADEVFALGETISRTTVSELRNVGVQTRPYFGDEVTPAVIQRSLRETDLLLWEGHARDLTLEEGGAGQIDAAPRLVVLQGCYTLDRSDPFILMERGSLAIVATSAAIYSASGSAFARSLFDGLLYDGLDIGTAVRNARNYLLALTHMKKLRGYGGWHKTYRAALAFTMWGDPTLSPEFRTRKPTVRPSAWVLGDDSVTLTLSGGHLPEAHVGRYRVRPAPRAMLGGLLTWDPGSDERRPKEIFYTVQHLATPSKVCAPNVLWDVASLYAPETGMLSVLVRPDWPLMRGDFAFPLVPIDADCGSVELEGPPIPPH